MCCRQWPEVSDFVAHFCTLHKSENTLPCKNSMLNTCETSAILAWQTIGSVFSDLHNLQKCVTQIIYLWPLPNAQCNTI